MEVVLNRVDNKEIGRVIKSLTLTGEFFCVSGPAIKIEYENVKRYSDIIVKKCKILDVDVYIIKFYRKNSYIVCESVSRYSEFKKTILELAGTVAKIEYIKFYDRGEFSKSISREKFNFIYDSNWEKIIPILDGIKNDDRINNLGVYLYGVSGAGKSKFAEQIALYLSYKILAITVRDLNSTYSDFMRKKQVILIEEIDKVLVNGEFTSEINVGNLLSLMDGTNRPDKTVLIIISNNNVVDDNPILSREGRVDVRLKFDNINSEQEKSVSEFWYPNTAGFADIVLGKVTISFLDSHLRNSIVRGYTYEQAREYVAAEVSNRRKKTGLTLYQ